MNSLLIVAVVFVQLLCIQAASIQNGGFEDNSCDASSWCEYSSTEIPGWTIGSGNIDLQFSTSCCGSFTAEDGDWSIDLNGDTPGSIYQTIETIPALNYDLTFWMASNPNCGPSERQLSVSTGFASETYTFSVYGTSSENPGWVQQSFSFTASSSSTTITFQSLTSGACGAAIDDVAITENDVVSICSGFTFTNQGYFCSADGSGFYQCLQGEWQSLSAFQYCPPGTTCACSYGVECSDDGSESPCRN